MARDNKADKNRVEIREGIIDSVKSDPKTTSNLVRKWLRETEE